MRLYTSMDGHRLFRNIGRMFPGARPPLMVGEGGTEGDGRTGSDALVQLLATTEASVLTSTDVEHLTGIPSRNLGRTCRTKPVQTALALFRWSVSPGRGKGQQSRLVREVPRAA
jgi:hypothetical protein